MPFWMLWILSIPVLSPLAARRVRNLIVKRLSELRPLYWHLFILTLYVGCGHWSVGTNNVSSLSCRPYNRWRHISGQRAASRCDARWLQNLVSLVQEVHRDDAGSFSSPMQSEQHAGRKSVWQRMIYPHRFASIRFEEQLTLLTPSSFKNPTKASEAILQLTLQSLKGRCDCFRR